MIISHLNVNSVRYKFSECTHILNAGNLDFLALTETKLDETFTNAQFNVTNYSMYRCDRNSSGGGIMVLVKSCIPHCYRNDMQTMMVNYIERMVFELTISKRKWLIAAMYKPPTIKDADFSAMFTALVENMLKETNYIMILGDLNFDMNVENKLSDLCCLLGLKNIINDNTCNKSENGTALDVILVSNKYCFNGTFNEYIGLSDFHNLIACSMKAFTSTKFKERIKYRSYKKFDEIDFLNDLSRININSCSEVSNINHQYDRFRELLCSTFDKHAPIKEKTLTKKAPPFMNGILRKAIFKKCMLRNKFYKSKTSANWENYKAQRNIVTSIRRQSIRVYFRQRTQNINDKDFWKVLKPFFSEKSKQGNENIILRESNALITDPSDVCNTFNTFYTTAAENIGFPDSIPSNLKPDDLLINIINKYSKHPSIMRIKSHISNENSFSFDYTCEDEVAKVISKLDIKKAIGYDGIPVKILKISVSLLTPIVTLMINHCIDKCAFPHALKLAEVSSIYKKSDKLCKENYRPISVLVIVSKVYEKIFVKRMSCYIDKIFNPLLSAYRNGYGCNDVLLKFVQMWKQALDENLFVGALLMDLSKAFDCLPHCLLIAKLHAYGFTNTACLLVASYLSDRQQRVKLGNARSDWKNLNKGVPQGSIMGPFLFNFFIHDLYYFIETSTLLNYADDDTLVYSHESKEELYSKLSNDSQIAIQWFSENGMKANPNKFQFIVAHRYTDVTDPIMIGSLSLNPEPHVKLLGITIDKRLNFDFYVNSLCKRAGKQLNVLKRFSNILGQNQRLRIFQTFIASIFDYCPTVWNFCSKTKAKLIEKIQERGLRYVYNDDTSTYRELLDRSDTETMHNIRLKKMVIYVYKCVSQIAPAYLHDMFKIKITPYEMRSSIMLEQPKVNTVNNGLLSFTYHGAKLWNQLPNEIKSIPTFTNFKRMVMKYNCQLCMCSYCSFVDHV